MILTYRHLADATLITVAGEVDAATSADLEIFIDRARRRLDEHLIVDMSQLSFLDSSGLAVLLAAATLARVHGAALHLAAVQPRVTRVLEITGTFPAVLVYDHVEQAIAAVEEMERARPAEPA
ncbi:STAS domain-containing protein [Nonomuraea turkmeniaca]|uniref:STAS domain-containing protein n=1 Tax=Nonomuraea turkmeniaca TaxID=103838 RepID=UPI001476FB7D|nr:STAS domain-containing protein [Nonomuraea turkmeniaca]